MKKATSILSLSILIMVIVTLGILPVLAQDPEERVESTTLLVSNSPNKSTALVGDTVIYTYIVVNNSSDVLAITGRDNKLGDLVWTPSGSGTFGPPALVPPGEQATATASYIIQETDLPGPFTNTVMITGTTQGSLSMLPVFNAEATASVELHQTFSIDPNDSNAQTIATDDGALTLIIPPNALPAGAQELLYVPKNEAPAGSAYPFPSAGLAFSLQLLDGSGNVIPNPSFHPPLLVTVSYDEADLPFNAQGAKEDQLMMYVLDDSTNTWRNVPIISRDTVGNSLTIYLSHLTDYGLGGPRTTFLPLWLKQG